MLLTEFDEKGYASEDPQAGMRTKMSKIHQVFHNLENGRRPCGEIQQG